jgi:hypothetical protein
MSDAVALQPSRYLPLSATLILVPLLAALLGLVIRYAGYAAVVSDASLADFADGLCRWDCQWYVRIAEEGYDPFPVPSMINAGNWAFFPLFPLLVALVRFATGLETMVAATGLSIALSVASARIAWPLLGRDLRAYTLFSAFLLCGPFSIYFTTFYTEVLFLFLTVCVFAALRMQRFLLAGILAALLSATRIVGVFIVLAMLFEMWRAHRDAGGSWRDFVPGILRRADWLLALAVAPLGLFAYMAYLHVLVGDALAFAHVQRAWGRPAGNPAIFVWNALTNLPKDGWWPTVSQQLGLATLAGYALTAVLVLRRRYAMAVYCVVCLTLPLFAGMASMLRFTAGLAPIPMVLSELLSRNRWLFGASLLSFAIAGYFTTIGWLTEYLTLV